MSKAWLPLFLVLVVVVFAGSLVIYNRHWGARILQDDQTQESPGFQAPDPTLTEVVREATSAQAPSLPEAPSPPPRLLKRDRDPEAEAALSKGLAALSKGDKVAANQLLLQGLPAAGAREDEILVVLDGLGQDLFFDPVTHEHLRKYTVRSGDTLFAIASRYGCAIGMIRKLNGLRGDQIHVGRRLLIPPSDAQITVSKTKHQLMLTMGPYYVKHYGVGLGKKDSTPEAHFVIQDKLVKPDWYPGEGGKVPYGDPGNPLGTRWMGFRRDGRRTGFGVHGTWDDNSIGRSESRGCIRMRNRDVEELYDIVPVGTPVIVDK